MFDAGSVIARVKADLSDFKDGLKQAQAQASTMSEKIKGGVEKMNEKIKDMTPALQKGAVAFGAIAAIGGMALNDWKEAAKGAQVEMARFNSTLDAVGGVTQKTRDQLLEAADAAAKMAFDDEDAANVLANFYQRTKDVTQATSLNNIAMDLARKKNIGLSDAANLVNQVLSGNGRVLKQYGIDLKEGAKPLEALGELQKVVGGQSNAYMETAEGKALALDIAIGGLKETLGDALLPIMNQWTDILRSIVGFLNDLSPEMQRMIAYVALGVTVFSAILAPVLGFITLIPSLTAGLATISGALAMVNLPLVAVIAVIGALALAWSTNLFGIQEKTMAFVSFVKMGIEELKFAWENDFLYMQTILQTIYSLIYDATLIFWETLKTMFSVALLVLTGNWQGAFEAMKNWSKLVFDTVGKWATGFWDVLTVIFTKGGELIGGLWNGFMDGIKNVTLSVWEGVKKSIVDAMNWIISKMNTFLGALNSVSGVLGKALGLGKKGFSIGEIPALAQGGIVTRPTLAMIGEGGESEAVIPLSKLGSVGGGGVHIHVDGAIIGSVDSAVELLDMAIRRVRPSLGV